MRLLLLLPLLCLPALLALASSPSTPPAAAQTRRTVTPSPRPTLVAPTAAVTPTATQPSAAAQRVAEALRAGFERTAAATNYRLTLVSRASGTVAGARGPGAEVLADFAGEFVDGDVSYLYRAPHLAREGLDPLAGLEAAIVGGTTYARGPLPIHGAAEPRWYDLGASAPALLRPRYSSATVLSIGEAVDLAALTRGATRAIDGRRCTAFQTGRDGARQALEALNRPLVAPAGPDGTPFDLRLDRGALVVWLCDDGLVRRVEVSVSGAVRQRPALVFGSGVVIDLLGFGARPALVAPPDAVALERGPETSVAALRAGPIRASPGGAAVGQLNQQDAVALIERTADGRWYRVRAPQATGWVAATQIALTRDIARLVPVAP